MDPFIRKRGAVKAKLTIFEKFVSTLEAKYPEKVVTERVEFLDLESRFEVFSCLASEFEQVQASIEAICELNDLEKQYQDRDTFETNYHKVVARARILLSNSVVDLDKVDSVSNAGSAGSSKHSSRASSSGQGLVFKGVKLPTIEIQTFYGDYNSWLEFRDTYESLIHNNESLSEIQKFHYLRSFLGPQVLEVIASLGFSNTNYKYAWQLICERYNNSKVLVQNHLQELFNLAKIQEESSRMLRKLADNIGKHIRSLNALNEPTDNWDTLLIYLIATKLDAVSLRKWENFKSEIQKPMLSDLFKFLRERANLLEALEQTKSEKRQFKLKTDFRSKHENKSRSLVTSSTVSCSFCRKEHFIQDCVEFKNLSVQERINEAKKKRLCLNCLRFGHVLKNCFSGPCKVCKSRHNSLLHIIRENKKPPAEMQSSDVQEAPQASQNVSCGFVSHKNEGVLLSTALVYVIDKNNKSFVARALLDPGSQSCFLSKAFSNKLATPREAVNIKVCGLNEAESTVVGKIDVRVQSLVNAFSMNMSCLIVTQITGPLPNFLVDMPSLNIPPNLSLADPNFSRVGPIDMLIGADYFWNLICVGQLKLGQGGPFLQKSKLGWIISGKVASKSRSNSSSSILTICNFVKTDEIDHQLSRFWEIEECSIEKPLSREEAACEAHFLETHKRDVNGRFIVKMPMKDNPEKLGDSYSIAKKQFLSLERRFDRDQTYSDLYHDFIDEYRHMGHMIKVNQPDSTPYAYYLPHHGVLKLSSSTTKLRTVFNASAKSGSGYSLNDLLMVGPTIQSDLITILLRFRKFEFVLSSDVAKMYRMVQVDPTQRCLLRIIWRDNPAAELDVYELNTVTYGTSAAAYLAIRCLYQLGVEIEKKSPVVANVIKNHFYVDDMLSGADTIEEAVFIANEVSKVLASGGFSLRKWVSNEPSILRDIESCEGSVVDIGLKENNKTLGLFWNGKEDSFFYKIGDQSNPRVTKRVVLSEIAQIFDPLGLLSACIIIVKLLLRDLWLERLDWDDSLSQHLHTRYLQIREDLKFLNDLKIDRKVKCSDAKHMELHIFSDASICAFGSCVYLRSIDSQGHIYVKLVCAKSKVAPLKVQTVPRLELMAAVLSARLAGKVMQALEIELQQVTFWVDSTIVLGWIRTPANLLQVFVANRVATIQEITNTKNWKHVRTQDNPADFVSRGIRPRELLTLDSYWCGPSWLQRVEEFWPESVVVPQGDQLPEMRKVVIVNNLIVRESVIDFEKYSDLTSLERIVSYCLRFKNNCLRSKDERVIGPLLADEIRSASLILTKISQHQSFSNEFQSLSKYNKVDSKSKLLKLHPFLDAIGLIRVGGRLNNSDYVYEKRHPLLLCAKQRYTKLLFLREHKRLLHAGPQHLLSMIRERYWPISGRNLAKGVFRDCVACFRVNPKLTNPIMASLPKVRVTPAPPFYTVGVDYAGWFQIKDRQVRGYKISKAYIAVFVCFTTRAIHLELVSDLTTEAFLAALNRFVGRRGKPAQIFSDNGTNFRGASHELNSLSKFLRLNSTNLVESIENKGIAWSFIPPNSPHFGGLWEAGVKIVKQHLKRVAGNTKLTFEQFYTLLVEIEAVVNSRPMTPISDNPSDLTPLTPSHFLIGRSLESLPERDYSKLPVNRLKQYQHIQQMKQHFWTRWSSEYLSELQQRVKWNKAKGELKINDLVLIKDENLPPLRWLLGRIVQVHPGVDDVIRVVTVKTQNGIITRAFSKICPLPTFDF